MFFWTGAFTTVSGLFNDFSLSIGGKGGRLGFSFGDWEDAIVTFLCVILRLITLHSFEKVVDIDGRNTHTWQDQGKGDHTTWLDIEENKKNNLKKSLT
jgi:hypothetical protein